MTPVRAQRDVRRFEPHDRYDVSGGIDEVFQTFWARALDSILWGAALGFGLLPIFNVPLGLEEAARLSEAGLGIAAALRVSPYHISRTPRSRPRFRILNRVK